MYHDHEARVLLEKRLDADAVRKEVPPDVRALAASATARALGRCDWTREHVRRRAESYYWAVVRGKCIRRPDIARVRAESIIRAVVDDLLDSGRDSDAVWHEIERAWAHVTPPEVLQEVRRALRVDCGPLRTQRVA